MRGVNSGRGNDTCIQTPESTDYPMRYYISEEPKTNLHSLPFAFRIPIWYCLASILYILGK